MVTPAHIPVFLNGRSLMVPPGTNLGQLLAQEEPELFRAISTGSVRMSDGRGVATDATAIVTAGAIFRVIQSARATSGSADA